MQNIAIIKQGTGRYLFSLPENVTLKEGDRVKCDTKRGITDGIAFADSAWVDENISQLIGKLTGAKFPLKSVVGRLEYLPFEKPQADNPANKYEGMSNTQLKMNMCTRGSCHVYNDGRRKLDCLFADDYGCPDVTDANRAAVIKYLLAEDAEAEPKPEDKQEPMKLYCVKDSVFGEAGFTKGTVCTFNPSVGALELPDGRQVGSANPRSYDGWKTENPFRAACLVPLVKRPAKVGEWVYITHTDYDPEAGARLGVGDVCRVASVAPSEAKHLEVSPGYELSYFDREYLVLDGYKPTPEAEPEPEYFSGKVVCVSSGDECFTVGKMYAFINGEVKDDEGDARPMHTDERFKSVEEWNEAYGMPIAHFIEFKGEAK